MRPEVAITAQHDQVALGERLATVREPDSMVDFQPAATDAK